MYIQLRLVNVLKHWLEHEPQDFELPEVRAALQLQLARMKQRGVCVLFSVLCCAEMSSRA